MGLALGCWQRWGAVPTPGTRQCEPSSQGCSACSALLAAVWVAVLAVPCPGQVSGRRAVWWHFRVALGMLCQAAVRGTTGQPVRPSWTPLLSQGQDGSSVGSSRVRLGLRVWSGVSSLGGHWRTELLAPVPVWGAEGPGWVFGLCLEARIREGSRLANALVTMYCGAAVLTALWHLCSGKENKFVFILRPG